MDRTWMPIVAGILNIIAGVFCLMGSLIIALANGILRTFGSGMIGIPAVPLLPFDLIIVTIPLIIFGILAIIGGIYATMRRIWGLALAGSIGVSLFLFFLGIPAIIFISLSKNEFS